MKRHRVVAVESLEDRRLMSQSFFVSATADAGGDGSAAHPWRSIAQVNAYGLATGFQPGDHIRFQAGQTFAGQLVLNQNGTRAEPITINTFGRSTTPNATIDAGNGSALTMHDVSGIVIEYLNLVGASQEAPLADAATISSAAQVGATSIVLSNVAGLTPGAKLDIDRVTDGASTHFYEEAYVASNYVAGSTTVPLLAPLVFAHGQGVTVNWDVHFGVAFVADDGAVHPRGVQIRHVSVKGFGGVYPSAGIAILGNGIRNGLGTDSRTASKVSLAPAVAGFDHVVIRDALVAQNGPTGILVGGNTFSGATDLNQFANFDIRIAHVVARRNQFPDAAIAAVDAAMHGPPHAQTGESGILVYDSQAVLINQVESVHNGQFGAGGAGIWTYRSDSVVIAHCESAFNRTAGTTDGNGIDLDGGVTNSVIQNCYTHDDDGAGLALYEYAGYRGNAPAHSGNTVQFNVSENDGRKNGYGSISLFNPRPNNQLAGDRIFGNTVYLSSVGGAKQPEALLVSGVVSTLDVFDNIFQTASTPGTAVPAVDINGQANQGIANVWLLHNDYFAGGAGPNDAAILYNGTPFTSVAAWSSASGQEQFNNASVYRTANPGLTRPGQGGTLGDGIPLDAGNLQGLTAYLLLASSPLIGAGLDPSALSVDPGATDFYGNLLPPAGGFSIGADQK